MAHKMLLETRRLGDLLLDDGIQVVDVLLHQRLGRLEDIDLVVIQAVDDVRLEHYRVNREVVDLFLQLTDDAQELVADFFGSV